MPEVSLHGVSVTYGEVTALHDVSARIPDGSLTALVGQNGAGKSTLMAALLGLLPFEGSISIGGTPPAIGRPDLAYIPDTPQLPGHLRAEEYLAVMGGSDRAISTAQMFGMASLGPISTYSRGMIQRLAIAGAIIRRPAFLIADEPTSALDPATRADIMDIFTRIRPHTTVLWSTHYLAELEAATHVIGLDTAMIYEGPPTLDPLPRWTVTCSDPERLAHLAEGAGLRVTGDLVLEGEVPSVLPGLCANADIDLIELRQVTPTIADLLKERHA